MGASLGNSELLQTWQRGMVSLSKLVYLATSLLRGGFSEEVCIACRDEGFDETSALQVIRSHQRVGPWFAGPGEMCNGNLPPQYAVLCQDGYNCIGRVCMQDTR